MLSISLELYRQNLHYQYRQFEYYSSNLRKALTYSQATLEAHPKSLSLQIVVNPHHWLSMRTAIQIHATIFAASANRLTRRRLTAIFSLLI